MLYGQTSKNVVSISVSSSLDGTPRGTVVYTQAGTPKEVFNDAPAFGSKSELFPTFYVQCLGGSSRADLVLLETNVSSDEGNICKVTLTYGWPQETESESSNDSSDSAVPDSRVSAGTYEDAVSILLHPKFSGVSDGQKILAKALLDGKQPYEIVYLSKTAPLHIRDSIGDEDAGNYTQMTFKEAVDKYMTGTAATLANYINRGITQYKVFRPTWSVTQYSKSNSKAFSGVGKISSPSGAPSHDGNWLKGGVSVSKASSDNYWEITTTWIASDPGAKWDAALYS